MVTNNKATEMTQDQQYYIKVLEFFGYFVDYGCGTKNTKW
jgi:hypothetical protein